MKNLITTIIITSVFITGIFANDNQNDTQKFYEITNNGQFRYMYWAEQNADNNKGGIKPVTERTFFLETERQGLLPEGMTYYTFIQLTIEEKQAILTNAQFEIIAAMNSSNQPNQNTSVAVNANNVAPFTEATEIVEESAATLENDELDINSPWIAKAVTRPGTEKELPTDRVLVETVEESTNLPWAVDVILNDGIETNNLMISNFNKIASSFSVAR